MHNQIKTSAFILLISSFSALHILEENIRMLEYLGASMKSSARSYKINSLYLLFLKAKLALL